MVKKEIGFLLKNKLLLFVVIVILIIPAIYACMFLSSMWDPYGEIGKLPVALVNEDASVDYNGGSLCVGKNIETSLKSNDAMDFHVTDKKTAEDGLKNGTYYMVITIPEDFSKNASTMMEDNPKKMKLQYATNPGYNYISSKLSESAMREITADIMAEVTTIYTQAVFDGIKEMGNGFTQAADGSSQLLTGMNTLNDGASTVMDNLNRLADSSATLHEGGSALNDGMGTYLDGVKRVDDGVTTLSDGTNQLADGVRRLQTGSQALSDGIYTMKKQIDDSLTADHISQIQTASKSLITMNDSIQQLNTEVSGIDISGISMIAQNAGDGLQKAGNSLGNAAANLVGKYAATEQASDLGGAAQKVVEAYKILADLYQDPTLGDAQRNLIAQTMQKLYDSNHQLPENTAYDFVIGAVDDVRSAGTNVQEAGSMLVGLAQSDLSGQVGKLKFSVNQLETASEQLLPASSKALDTLLSGMQNVQMALGQTMVSDGKTGIMEGISGLNAGIASLNDAIMGISGMKNGVDQLKSGTEQLVENGNTLKNGINQISDGTARLSDGAAALAEGSVALQDGIEALIDGTTTMDEALTDGANAAAGSAATDSNIDMLVTPLEAEETQITTVANNGHAMAAYMMSVGLWVGCLAFCLMYPLVEYHDKLKNGLLWYASKAAVVYPMAVTMGIVLYLALHIINGFQPVQTGNTILVSVMSAICFMTMMYFFNALAGKVGSFFMLVFMVLQLAGSAGTYPIEISGNFAAAIHRYVPFTYTVNAFRSAISGGTGIGNELLVLITITVIFMLLTVCLFVYRAKRVKAGKKVFYTWIEEHGLA